MYTVLINGVVAHDPSLNNSSRVLANCVVTKKVNTADSFTFTIYPDNVVYDLIDLSHEIFVEVRKDSTNLFYGRILKEDTGWDNEKKITCEGALAFLNDSIIRPYEYQGDVLPYLRFLINSHNSQMNGTKQFTIRNVTVTDPNNNIVRSNSDYTPTITELLNKTSGSDLGGYLVVEYSDAHIYLDYLVNSTNGTNQTIALGSNLIDFQRSISSESMATGVIPLGAKNEEGTRLTVASVNDGKDYVLDSTAVTNKGIIYTTCVFDDITTPAYLLARARGYLSDLTRIVPRIELNAVDLTLAGYAMEDIGFFEYVTVEDTVHGVNGQYLITERTWNLSNPENDKVTFGGADKTISGQSSKNQNAITLASEAVLNQARSIIDYQTELLKGGSGGYFVIGSDEDGHPSEVYFLDTNDRTTARSILRINKNGIGFSTTGFDGPYTNAWTIDGRLNASYITTGTLKDAATNGQKFSFNLETGEMYLDALDILVGGLYVGGRNLIINSLNAVISPAEDRIRIIGQNGNTVVGGAAGTAEHGIRSISTTPIRPYIRFGAASGSMNGLVAGQTYTFSADVSWVLLSNYTGTTKFQIRAAIYGNASGSMATQAYADIEPDCTTNKTGTAKCRFTFTVDSNTTEVYLYVYCNDTTSSHYATTDYLEIANVKLEIGEVATAWSPAYEDLNGYADHTAAAQISAHDEEIYLAVSETYTSKEDAAVVNMMPSIYAREYSDGKEYASTSGITWTVNDDGSVTAKGTASSITFYSLTRCDGVASGNVPPIRIDPDKKYTLSGCPAGSSGSTYKMFYRLYTDDTTHGSWIGFNDKVTFGPTYKYVEIGIQIYANYTCPEEGITFYPMLEPGTIAHGYISPRNGTGAIGDLAKTNKASIDLQAQKIAIVVEEKNGVNVIKSASIVTAINDDSSVTINANRINLQGAVTISSLADDVKTELDKAGEALSTANAANGKAVAFRGICSTVATTAAKTVTSGNFTGPDLVQGATVTVYNGTANTTSDSALTLNVNGTGAKQIYVNGAVTSSTNQLLWTANSSITYTYDGTHWRVEDKPGVWYGSTCSVAAATAAKTTTVNEVVIFKGTLIYVPMSNANTNESATMNVSSLGAKNIYYGTTTTRPTTANAHGWIAGKSVALTFDGAYWRLGEGATYIDGGHIITGTIDASKATITNIDADNITSGTISADRIATNSLSINKLSDLSVGGRNYLVAISNKYGRSPSKQYCSYTYDESSATYVLTVTEATTSSFPQIWLNYNNALPIPTDLQGKSGIFSCDKIECSNSNCDWKVYILFWNSSGSNDYFYTFDSSYTKYSRSITIPTTATRISLLLRVAQTGSKVAVGDTFTVRGPKFELGTVQTAWTPAPEDQEAVADSALATANNAAPKTSAVAETQRVYYRSNSTTAPTAPTSWVTSTSTANSTWTTKRMQYDSTYKYLYTCIQKKTVSGTITNTTVLLDDTTTIIDGGNIITGSVTANQLAANSVTAEKISVTDLNALGATIAGWNVGVNAIYKRWSSDTMEHEVGMYSPASPSANNAAFYVSTSMGGATAYPFQVKYDGRLYATQAEIEGKITATDGSIGGWEINESYIYKNTAAGTSGTASTQYQIAMYGKNGTPSSNDIALVAYQRSWDGSKYGSWTSNFYVTYGGKLYAKNAEIEGTITSTNGKIGGWDISSGALSKSTANGVSGTASTQYDVLVQAINGTPTSSNNAIIARQRSWDGSKYGSWTSNFYVTYGGKLYAKNVEIFGKIHATGGDISGWTIGATDFSKTATVQSGNTYTQYQIYFQANASPTGTTNAINVRTRSKEGVDASYGSWSQKFTVAYNGKMVANDADITGKITANDGHIGRYQITSTSLYATGTEGDNSTMAGMGGNQAFWAGSDSSNSAPFKVSYSGKIVATDAEISGKITATSGSISGSLVTSGISASNVTTGTLSANRLDIAGLFAKNITASNFNITGGSFSVSASKGTNKLTLTDSDGAYTKIYTGMVDLKYVDNTSESVDGGRTLISGNGISFYNASGTAKGSINQNGSINGLYATSISNAYGNLANTGASLTASANSVSTSSGTVKALTHVTLPYGKWVVVGTATFATNSSGYRKISVSTTSASVGTGFVQTTPGSTGSVQTVLTTCGIFTVTSSTAVYLNSMQNSATALSVSGSITAIRII